MNSFSSGSFSFSFRSPASHGFLFKQFIRILCFSCLLLASGCENFLKPYKLPIQQGNIVTEEKLAQLEKGMTKEQVLYLLGTPMLVDTFDKNEWFYLYRLKAVKKEYNQQKQLRVSFQNNQVAEIQNDYDFSEKANIEQEQKKKKRFFNLF